jgi:nucleoside-diphosphate-sugar epimerase
MLYEENKAIFKISDAQRILGKGYIPQKGAKRAGDVRKTYADISRIKRLLGLKPKVSFDEGLKKTTEWFQKNQERLLKI